MGASGAIKDFKFEGEDGKAQHISTVLPVSTYLVQYFDHAGKQQTRLVARETTTGTSYIIKDSIQGQHVLVPATKWFEKQMKEKVEGQEVVESV